MESLHPAGAVNRKKIVVGVPFVMTNAGASE